MEQNLKSPLWWHSRMLPSFTDYATTFISTFSKLPTIATKMNVHNMTTKKKIFIGISIFFISIAAIALLSGRTNVIKTEHFTFIFSSSIESQNP
jgi:hypothetical protein